MSEYSKTNPEAFEQCLARMKKRYLDCCNISMEEAELLAEHFIKLHRDINFWIGDLARYCEIRWPETYHQVFPEWVSPGLLARTAGVCRAYPSQGERQHEATYSQYRHVAGKPDRQKRLAEIVDKGQTTDETRAEQKTDRWLLAVDVNFYLHKFWHSGAYEESAVSVARWIQRLVERLKTDMGLTDVACCFDSKTNHRKELTADWDDKEKYKGNRGPKDFELIQQIQLVHELLSGYGFCCVSVEGMEADDVMASYAKQFCGRVTLLSGDKDQRQCLSSRCNILLGVDWVEDESSGDFTPDYNWLTAKRHTEETGIAPSQWIDYQCIAGDNVDQIKGAIGVGETGAASLIREFGSVEAAIDAARNDSPEKSPWKPHTGPRGGKGWKHEETGEVKRGEKRPDDRSSTWEPLLELADKLEVTRQLVTMRTDLKVPNSTRI